MRRPCIPNILMIEVAVVDSHGDPVSAELRSAERQIDAYYKRNHLVELPFATAAWHLMVAWEDAMDPRCGGAP